MTARLALTVQLASDDRQGMGALVAKAGALFLTTLKGRTHKECSTERGKMARSYRDYETLVFALKNCYNTRMANLDPILTSFRSALDAVYGDRLERVVLFGSRARGDNQPDSDYDVAVFLKSMSDRWEEIDLLTDLGIRFIDETGEIINALPYASTAYQDRTPLMGEIRREGIDL